MNSPKAKEQILKVISDIEKGAEAEAVANEMMEIRKIALAEEDPLMVKTFRIIADKIKEDESLDFDIEIEMPVEEVEEGEEEEEYEAPDNHLTYLLSLMADSDNKYNREEIKLYRTAIWDDIY
tara:strand:+ start:780 stop:1148 length:369 start_codon:yes stop_codon:yes gene_type:complete